MSPQIDLRLLRPKKREWIEKNCQQIDALTFLHVEEHHNATILPIRRNRLTGWDLGGVLDNDGQYVVSSVVPGWVRGYYDDFVSVYEQKTVVYCGRMIGQWGHFLLETITRLWFFLQYDRPSYEYVFLVKEATTPPIEGNFMAFFRLLGIAERVRLLSIPTRFEMVLIPERSFQYRRFFSPYYSSVIDRVVQRAMRCSPAEAHPPRVFLSRSRFQKARDTEVGLEYLDHYFEKNGYQILYPEQVKLDQLIRILFDASECAVESGTVAHNVLFCSEQNRITVIERQGMVNEAQLSIERARNLNTRYVDGNISLYPVSMGAGPFFLFFTDQMERMSEEMSYFPPDSCYTEEAYILACLAKYREMRDRIGNHEAANLDKDRVALLREAQIASRQSLSRVSPKVAKALERMLPK